MTLVEVRRPTPRQPEPLPPAARPGVPWETLAYLGLALLGFALRMWELGERAYHHDESLHAVYSWYLYVGRGYTHDPMMHGPFQFLGMALLYFLFGANDVTGRLLAVLCGTALIVVPYFLRHELGRAGALVAAALLTLTPSFLYFSRFAREDIYTALHTLLIVVGLFGYIRTADRRWMLFTAVAFALSFATKETTFITAFLFTAFLAGALLLGWWLERRPALPLVDGPLANELRALWGLARATPRGDWLAAAGVFLGITVVLYTTFFTNPRGLCTMLWSADAVCGSGVRGALQYWLDQHPVRRGGQPWYYYLLLLPLYEALTVALAGAALVLLRGRRTLFFWFNVWWALGALVIYSWAGEKMPWLIVHLLLPLVLLAALFLGRWIEGVDWRRFTSAPSLAAGGLALGMLAVLASFFGLSTAQTVAPLEVQVTGLHRLAYLLISAALGFGIWRLWRAHGAQTVRPALGVALLVPFAAYAIHAAWMVTYEHGDIPVEMLVYVQTSPDVPWVVEEIERIGKQTGQGKDLKILMDNGWGDGVHESIAWPFEWYLRDYKQRRYFTRTIGADVNLAEYPVILVMAPNVDPIRPVLGEYHGQKYKLNWWYPEDYKGLAAEPPTIGGVRLPIPWLNWQTVAEGLLDPVNRAKLVKYVLYRELVNPPLGAREFYFYVRNDIPGIGPAGLPIGAGPALTTASGAQPTPARRAAFGAPLTVDGPVTRFGGTAGQSALLDPKGIAVGPDGRLYVTEGRGHRVTAFNPDGTVALQWGREGSGDGEFKEPWGIAVAPDGEIYVADTWNHRIQRFDAGGNFLGQWGGLADARGRANEATGLFWGPRDVVIGADGSVYVSDTGNKRVQVFDRSGRFLRAFGGDGAAPGQLREPVGLALDREGNLYVADAWNGRIQKLDPSGRPLAEWPLSGWESRSVTNKPYLAVDAQGRILATLPELGQVVVVSSNGEARPILWPGVGSFGLPTGLRVGPGGELYVSDSTRGVVLRLPAPN